MIQSTKQVWYGNRSEKRGKIRIEVRRLSEENGLNKFLIIDWDITENPIQAIQSFEKTYTDAEIDASDTIIEASNSFVGLTRSQKAKKILAIRLMQETQTQLLSNGKTIYQLTALDWEYVV